MTVISIYFKTCTYPLKSAFTISRGSKTEIQVIEITIDDPKNQLTVKGEAVPYPRYDHSPQKCQELFQKVFKDCSSLETLTKRAQSLEPGPLKNAISAALWQYNLCKSKKSQAFFEALKPLPIMQTLSLDTPEAMGMQAKNYQHFKYLKVKLGAENILPSLQAICQNAPKSRIIIDANEAWSLDLLNSLAPKLEALNTEFIEQPLPEGQDELLSGYTGPIPLAADESCHDLKSYDRIKPFYQIMNLKLDKTGGLDEAFALFKQAKADQKKIMVGCMVSSSLSILPAFYLGQKANYCDLDGASFLAKDPYDLVRYEGDKIAMPVKARQPDCK